MTTKITATELARNLSDILNRVRYKGESFTVERNGEVVAELKPGVNKPALTGKGLLELYARLPLADDNFADDLEAVHASQGKLPAPPEWPS